jgi:resolvase-like protein
MNRPATGKVPSRTIAYLRVSTDKQADSGLGLEAQRTAVNTAAGRLGLPLASVLVDAGVSGALSAADRPVLLQAVGALRRGDALLVAKRDRLGRDVIEVALIERMIARRGARVVSAAGEGTDSTDPSGLLMRRLVDSFAEVRAAVDWRQDESGLPGEARLAGSGCRGSRRSGSRSIRLVSSCRSPANRRRADHLGTTGGGGVAARDRGRAESAGALNEGRFGVAVRICAKRPRP